MKKRIMIGLAALCLVLVTGCSGGSTDKTNEMEATSNSEATSETPASTSQTDNTKNENVTKDETEITLDQAKTIALKEAGLKEKDGSWKKAEQDHEDGRIIYELEFISGETEYEFEIDAKNGNILESKKEPVND